MFTKTGLRIGGEGRQILQYPADQKYWIIYSYSTYNHQYQSIVRLFSNRGTELENNICIAK